MRKAIKWTIRVGVAIAILIALFHQMGRAVDQMQYETCLEIPQEVRKYGSCEQFNPNRD